MTRYAFVKKAVAVVVPAGVLLLAGCGLLEARPDPPQPPEDVRASEGEYPEQIVLVWSEVEGADRYRILRARNDDYKQVGDPVTKTIYQDTNATTGSFWYKVVACGPGGCSAESQAVTGSAAAPKRPVPPLPPTDVRASEGEHGHEIAITWQPAERAEAYTVYRAEAATGPFEEIARTQSSSYRDEDVDQNVVFWYRVQSEDDAGRKSMLSAFARGWAH